MNAYKIIHHTNMRCNKNKFYQKLVSKTSIKIMYHQI